MCVCLCVFWPAKQATYIIFSDQRDVQNIATEPSPPPRSLDEPPRRSCIRSPGPDQPILGTSGLRAMVPGMLLTLGRILKARCHSRCLITIDQAAALTAPTSFCLVGCRQRHATLNRSARGLYQVISTNLGDAFWCAQLVCMIFK